MKKIKITGVIVLALLLLTPFLASSASLTTLSGTYIIHDFDSTFQGYDSNGGWGSTDEHSVMRAVVTFDGAGGVTSSFNEDTLKRAITEVYVDENPVLSNKFITTHSTESGTITGTYTVLDDGTFTLIFPVGEGETDTITGTVSEDGSTAIFGYSEFHNSDKWGSSGIGVGVKKIELLKGDVNGDTNVNLADAILALKVIVGLNPAGINLNADVNGDNKIDLAEVIYILQYVTGLR